MWGWWHEKCSLGCGSSSKIWEWGMLTCALLCASRGSGLKWAMASWEIVDTRGWVSCVVKRICRPTAVDIESRDSWDGVVTIMNHEGGRWPVPTRNGFSRLLWCPTGRPTGLQQILLRPIPRRCAWHSSDQVFFLHVTMFHFAVLLCCCVCYWS
jgi:hypothetical protein